MNRINLLNWKHFYFRYYCYSEIKITKTTEQHRTVLRSKYFGVLEL